MLSLLDVKYKQLSSPEFDGHELRDMQGIIKIFSLAGNNYVMILLDNGADADNGDIYCVLGLLLGKFPEKETIVVEADENFNIGDLEDYPSQAAVYLKDMDEVEALNRLIAKVNA